MKKNMKRRQFHLSVAEEQTIYDISRQKNIPEAEVVRMAIQKLGEESIKNDGNPLLTMAKAAEVDSEAIRQIPEDASENFSEYYTEIIEDEGK